LFSWIGFSALGLAEEGMWPPQQLPEIAAQLRKAGLELDPSKLTSLTEHPMNAVISLGGCTASFVSPNGLIVTNHHCAYGSIQYNSTADRNLLEEGFYAAGIEDELPAAPGSRVFVTVEFRDVSDAVLSGLSDTLSGLDRYKKIEQREKELVADCEKEPGYRCRVASYYGGLSFYLVRQFEIRDVRLVYAPPSGIGKFGGDIDNWMWPRHTGDYSFYRAYVGPDGKTAAYAKENVPFRPKHYLRVSAGGVKEGDFVMVAGYPGATSRYRLAAEVESAFKWGYPTRIEAYREWLGVIDRVTQGRPDVRLRYAALESGLNNTLKNNEGMIEGFAKSPMLAEKRQLERDFQNWIASDPTRKARLAPVYEQLVAEIQAGEALRERDLYYALVGRSSMLGAARQLYRLSRQKQKPDMERDPGYQQRDFERIREGLAQIDRRYHPDVDRAVLEHFLLRYQERVPAASRVKPLDDWFSLRAGQDVTAQVRQRLEKMYAETKLGDTSQRLALLDATPAQLEASSDPFIRLAVALYPVDEAMQEQDQERAGRVQLLSSRYMGALIEYLKGQGKAVYPDANGTLRVTYGNVKGYIPRDAVIYKPFTFIEGILEKDTGVEPFNTPAKALEAMRSRRFGRWIMPGTDSVPVNFLSTVDTTGGNSGSPTLNARGELVGLLFDGNYESMISNWDFMPEITRSIHVDFRYVLWCMEEVDKADRLLKEMEIVN